MSDRIEVLQRIAAFAAEVRGHALGEWRAGEEFSVARCIHCGHELTVCRVGMQPEMDGPAFASACPAAKRSVAA